jgi:hypothetical protein
MKHFTEEEIVEALNQGRITIEESAKKENRDLNDFEKDMLNSNKETSDQIIKAGRHFKRIKQLAQNNYTEESIILTVTFFEILIRELIKKSKTVWFYLPSPHFSKLTQEQKELLQAKIQKYLHKRNLEKNYSENLKKYQNDIPIPEIEALYDTLFDDKGSKSKINFQNLGDKNGVREAIIFFFEIDISKGLHPDQKISQKRWILLNRLIQDRHSIVHCGNTATLKTDEIIEVLYSIDTLTDFIYKKILPYYSGRIMQDFEIIKLNLKTGKNPFNK